MSREFKLPEWASTLLYWTHPILALYLLSSGLWIVAVMVIIVWGCITTGRDKKQPATSYQPPTISKEEQHQKRKTEYEAYLESPAWQRKRYVVLKRDNWRCVSCGNPATQVHHRKYAKIHIGREPIHWLESLCAPCHATRHSRLPTSNTVPNRVQED